MKLHFAKSVQINQLHTEILAGCAEVCPINGFAQMILENDDSNVWLTLPDDLSIEAQQKIAAIIANHVPQFQPQPNWAQFRTQVSTHPAYLRLVTDYPYNGVLNSLLIPLLWQVGDNRQLLGEVTHLWNMMTINVPLTEDEISQLNAIATGCNVPLQLNALGAMEVL